MIKFWPGVFPVVESFRFTIDAMTTTNLIVLNVVQHHKRYAIMDAKKDCVLSAQDALMGAERTIA